MAVYLDLENIALGARDAKYPSFDIEKVLARLLLKGHIVVKKVLRLRPLKALQTRSARGGLRGSSKSPRAASGKNSATSAWSSMRSICATRRDTSIPSVIISATRTSLRSWSKLRENAKTVIASA